MESNEQLVDEDIEEGVHFSQTQKIPISLIKHQDKGSQQQFYQPTSTEKGPKLNNFLKQAAYSKHERKPSGPGSKNSSALISGRQADNASGPKMSFYKNKQQKSFLAGHHQKASEGVEVKDCATLRAELE